MKLLVIGSGGREHALAWQFARQGHDVLCAPGNAGTSRIADCRPVDPLDIPALADLARAEKVDLTVVGPEAPLVDGIADRFEEAGLKVFGPDRRGARLEGDKSFAKRLMQQQNIPTASFATFDDYDRARDYLESRPVPVVIKASGLAAGKGVIICPDRDTARQTLKSVMVDGRFGAAGSTVVIEEFLEGEEASIIALCDGGNISLTVPSQDHKPLEDGDRGPNTGGMGAYAPAPVADADTVAEVRTRVFEPLLRGLQAEGITYRGVIYAGIMLTRDGLKVLEFNCRFGDPETQAVLPLLDSDLAELALACVEGRLAKTKPAWSDRSALCVVLASGGYPGKYRKGLPISGDLDGGDDMVVFHAGTRLEGDGIVTSGGRVLGVTGLGDSLREARDRAYAAVAGIRFDDAFFRRDIGNRGLARLDG